MCMLFYFFFFNDTATTEIYTLSLHDALPILGRRQDGLGEAATCRCRSVASRGRRRRAARAPARRRPDPQLLVSRRSKSTRLNSSHANISYAVFCLKKKKRQTTST